MLTRLDDLLLDRVFQSLADAVGARWGLNCHWLARQCALAKLCMCGVAAAAVLTGPPIDAGSAEATQAVYRSIVTTVSADIALSVLIVLFLGWAAKSTAAAAQRGVANPLRRTLSPLRLACLLFLLIIPTMMLAAWMASPLKPLETAPLWSYHPALAVMLMSDIVLMAAAHYFASCSSQLPARKPKAASALGRLLGRLAPHGAGA